MNKKIVYGGFPPEFYPEWLVAEVLANSEDPYNLVNTSRTETLQWLGFVMNICLQMSERDVKGELQTVLGRREKAVVVKGCCPHVVSGTF